MKNDFRNQNKVTVIQNKKAYYPLNAPFNPSEFFPEYLFKKISKEKNYSYPLLRNLLKEMGLDRKNFGKANWNPLGDIIKPGNNVLIKPNWVKDINPIEKNLDSLITNTSLIRAILDYIVIALKGKGKITIGDAPLQSCDFDKLIEKNQIKSVINFYKKNNIDIEIQDFRLLIGKVIEYGFLNKIIGVNLKQIENKKIKHTIVKLNKESFLEPISKDWKRFRVTSYDPRKLFKHHRKRKHEYIVANSVLEADVIINMPKMKSHIKAGITGALKNFIGINGHKDYLPHHRLGSAEQGFDEYDKKNILRTISSRMYDLRFMTKNLFLRKLIAFPQRLSENLGKFISKDYIHYGCWYKNDTINRTTLDLNKIVYFANKYGTIKENPQRIILNIIDGIVAGEGNGPLSPEYKKCGILIGGFNGVAVDFTMADIMGFDWEKIPTLKLALTKNSGFINFNKNNLIKNNFIKKIKCSQFKPPTYWRGHIEKNA